MPSSESLAAAIPLLIGRLSKNTQALVLAGSLLVGAFGAGLATMAWLGDQINAPEAVRLNTEAIKANQQAIGSNTRAIGETRRRVDDLEESVNDKLVRVLCYQEAAAGRRSYESCGL